MTSAQGKSGQGNALSRGERSAAQHFGPLAVDAARYALRRPGAPDIPLTDRELGLLRLFAAHPGEVLSRDRLLDELWGVHYAGTTRTLDQHIAQLRRKLGAAASLLETVHGVGYRYRPVPESAPRLAKGLASATVAACPSARASS